MREGIIIKGIGGFYDVAWEGQVYRCRARGRFRKMGITPMVGDRVRFLPESAVSEGALEEILPRRNQLLRPPVANMDTLAVVIAPAAPEPDLLLADKLFILAGMKDIAQILVINKIDLAEADREEALVQAYTATGFPILQVSSKKDIGMEALGRSLSGGIATLAGQSGVGKSSLLNRLHPPLSLEVGSISVKAQRGKHTTRHVELLSLPFGGHVVDTPGFSALEHIDLSPEELASYYPDYQPLAAHCRFQGCKHYKEPDCAVAESVHEGSLNQGRYARYIRILEEIMENRREPWC